MSIQKCYFKSIRLYPSEFEVDVWIGKDRDLLAENFHKRYGASVDYYKEELRDNAVQVLRATMKSELKGDKVIVMNVESLDLGILIHELNHIYYHLCSILHITLHHESQEWHSYMLEYLYEETKDIKTYKIIENELSKVLPV